MTRRRRKAARGHRAQKAGLPPGTPIYTGVEAGRPIRISVLDYDAEAVSLHEDVRPEDLARFRDSGRTSWISVDGVHDVALVQKIAETFGLHPLVVEDIVNVGQRPKCDNYGDYVFIVSRNLSLDAETGEIATEQVAFVLGKGWLITFEEHQPTLFGAIASRIAQGQAQARQKSVDYLLYRLLDTIVDNYFVITEQLGIKLEELEDRVVANPGRGTIESVLSMKRALIEMRRSVWPMREVISWLERGESPLLRADTRIYFRDIYDHTIQLIDMLENLRDLVGTVHELYLNAVNLRLSEVMKALTLISTIFMPITFIASVGGMNVLFPGKEQLSGWYGALGLMGAAALGMFLWFRTRRWL
ncbi:MAG: magnesium/cobalt transporter CorA [Acidobacteria bacterium]|nr:magnesium/cobalt transporter CorA [Acidobacteriota bacterium]